MFATFASNEAGDRIRLLMKAYHIVVVGATGAVGQELLRVLERRPHVPLVIPEINAEDARRHRGLIANPNCTTAVTLMALYPLHRAFGVRRTFAASYQAVSGSGARAINELTQQVKDAAQEPLVSGSRTDRQATPQVYPHPIAFNLLPHVDSFLESGYTKEEMKFQDEGRKIMHLPEFRASVTCVRVPVYRAHSVAVSAEFERPVSVEHAREVLAKAPGLELVDELSVAGKDNCEVGRIRVDCAFENGLSFWVSGDQLLKGAALNAVQIAELLCWIRVRLAKPRSLRFTSSWTNVLAQPQNDANGSNQSLDEGWASSVPNLDC